MVHRQDTAEFQSTIGKAAVGVGLRPEHYQAALEANVPVDFLEVHSENFFADDGILIDVLQDVSARTPVSLHGTAAGLGSAAGVPDDYLMQLKRLVDRVNPVLVSDHLCFTWGKIGNTLFHGGDLLPVPYTAESLCHAVVNVDRVQSYLGRQIAVENVCAYLDFGQDDYEDAAFLSELAARTGCGLILDINNLMVNARNAQANDFGAYLDRYLEALDKRAILEMHLAGSTAVPDSELLIDDHACPVSEAGWDSYRRALERIGPKPTLVEWDNNLPSWPVLLDEGLKAKALQRALLGGRDDVV